MRAVICEKGQLTVTEVADPVPGPGQVLLDVLRCGICGSDLHARTDPDTTADALVTIGYDAFMRHDHAVVLGHEFLGRVVAYGPKTRQAVPVGTRVVAMPILEQPDGPHLVGFTEQAPGAYAEQVIASEVLIFPVPTGVSDDHAALTEPLAVATHAVRRARPRRGDTAVVIGCGPIGLGVILAAKAAGVKTVIASDLSPRRRELARACGADIVIDPATESPWDKLPDSYIRTGPALFDLLFTTMRRLGRIPRGAWRHLIRAADRVGGIPRGPIIFECVGVPGMIDSIIGDAPLRSRVVVVGVCMQSDTIRPALAINKELSVEFVFGYDPAEFYETLLQIAKGAIDPSVLVTGTVGLDGVDAAFTGLGDPERHAKILIDPSSTVTAP